MSVCLKVCCIQNEGELSLAQAMGADAVGLVSQMPSGQGTLPDDRIASLASAAPAELDTFLLTAETIPERIITHYERTRTRSIQLVDAVAPGSYSRLRAALPGIRLIQVIHMTGPESVDLALTYADVADALLLDSGDPGRRELGGTGRTHDWALSRSVRERVSLPVWLAGGLRYGNVATAIRKVQPYGVDVCSGLRPEGKLDAGLLKAFRSAIQEA